MDTNGRILRTFGVVWLAMLALSEYAAIVHCPRQTIYVNMSADPHSRIVRLVR